MFPERLECDVTADGRPLAGALVDVSLSMTAKNPAHDGAWSCGQGWQDCGVRRGAAWACLAKLQTLCHGLCRPRGPLRRLRERQASDARSSAGDEGGIREFNRYFDYPEAWDRTLEDLAAWFARHQVSTLAVTVTVTPAVIRVTAAEIQV
jgi:hypothetical protein